jgi:hypothetical protein
MACEPPPIQEQPVAPNSLFPQTWIKWFQDICQRITDLEAGVSGAYSSFGEQIIAQLHPTIQIANQYALDPALREDIETFSATGGSVDNSDTLFRCQSGTSEGGYGVIRSAGALRYRAGEGAICRITAAFTTGIASSLQFGGLFSLTDSAAFGYDGADFSVIHQYGGVAEIQTITMTGTAADTVTITLNGTAASGISITNATVATNAQEVYAALNADSAVNTAWRFEQIDDTVICIAQSVGDKTGTMSATAAGSATLSIAETVAGAAKTDNMTAQTEWDTAPFSGFDPTKLNIYQIQYAYLGVANIEFSIYNPTLGLFQLVHKTKWANSNSTPNFSNPNMKTGWISTSLGSSGTNLTVTGASMMGAIEGEEVIEESSHAHFAQQASISTTLYSVFTLQNRIVYGTKFNLGVIHPVSISIDNDHNKGIIVELIKNATLAGVPNYQYHNLTNSLATIDEAGTTVTGGEVIDAFTVGTLEGSGDIDLGKLQDFLLPEETLTVAVRTVSGTATNTTASLVWREEK